MNPSPLVTIVIDNYNYARFLGAAIDSALQQSYAPIQVIVVDDGSTDVSRAVVSAYEGRVEALFQENGGQASALNAGFEMSRGDVIIFLDADDRLHPTVAERVVEAFRLQPQAVRAQYRLEIVDASGAPTGESTPPRAILVPRGDLRRAVMLYGDDIPWLPTSGNAYRAEMLRRIFPIPVESYRICADYYLSNLSPLFGEIASLDESGGYYRIHASNNHASAKLNVKQTRELIVRTQQTHDHLRDFARQLGLHETGRYDMSPLSISQWANRLVSLRLDPAQHPITGDTRLNITLRGANAAMRRPALSPLFRVAALMWFLVGAVAPQRLLRRMAELFFFPEARVRLFASIRDAARAVRPASLRRQV